MIYQDFITKYKPITKGEFFKFDNCNIFKYLDEEFENELINNPNFFIWYIKLKFGKIRISSNSNNNIYWEQQIEKILADN
jgi:hypothetical protein